MSRELIQIGNSDLHPDLQAVSTEIAQYSEALLRLLDEQILNKTRVSVESGDYFRLASQPLDALLNIFVITMDYSAENYAKLC